MEASPNEVMKTGLPAALSSWADITLLSCEPVDAEPASPQGFVVYCPAADFWQRDRAVWNSDISAMW